MPPETQLQPPHGLMGLEPLPFYEEWQNVIWLSLIITSLLLLLLYIWGRRRALRARPHVKPPTPWDELQREVALLKEPVHEADIGPFYLALSAALRKSLELRYGFPASRQTLGELSESLAKLAAVSGEERQSYLDFLGLADRAKFAGDTLEPNVHRHSLEQLRQWVRGGEAG